MLWEIRYQENFKQRLRAGSFRVFFDFDGAARIVSLKNVMNVLTESVQIIRDAGGHPAFVVLPFVPSRLFGARD